MTKFILHLDKAEDICRDQAGGKGYTLTRLCQADFPVPPAFIITADAYRAVTANNALDTMIANALTNDDPATASKRIVEAFGEAEIPSAIAAAIQKAYQALGEGLVAVRSSALAEDSQATSFAGQHETFLDIAGSDTLLTAVRRCWASLWSERALAYRRHRSHIPTPLHSHAVMAVVVQQMVPSAQSGVAFTLDPISGRHDVIIVEAVAGKGEALVGGLATPHRYVVQQENIPPTSRDALLDSARLATVVCLAQEVEAWAGEPQDIEWALDATGHIHLLQARPITVAGDIATEARVTHWTRDNVGEVLPDPVTPLSWSVLDPLGNRSFAGVLRRLGMKDYPSAGMFGRFYDRVYLNLSLFQAMMRRFYLSYAGWRAAPRLALTALKTLWMLRRLPSERDRVIQAIMEQYHAERETDLADLAPITLLDLLTDWRRRGAEAMEVHLAVSVMGELFYQALDKLLVRWGDGMTTAITLTGGLKGVRSAEAGWALATLTRQICQDQDLRDLVLATATEALPDRLSETKAGQALWSQIEALLAEHGHSAAQEFELAAPRWRDDPTIILSALQAQVRTADEGPVTDPSTTRLEAVARVEKQLGLLKRWLFRYLLSQSQTFSIARENLKYHFVIAHSRLRDLYLALAAQCVTIGGLTDAHDVFFLTDEEVAGLVKGELTPDESRERVVERRRAWEMEQTTSPPVALHQLPDGRLRPLGEAHSVSEMTGDTLHGLAASPGQMVGRARVVLNPADGADLKPGEVLVAPATSPGWAPLFLAAGALVTDIGGMLSHGAIIAREYGLPAVLNVTAATRRIRTGQLIHVDGSRGTIKLLKDVEHEQ